MNLINPRTPTENEYAYIERKNKDTDNGLMIGCVVFSLAAIVLTFIAVLNISTSRGYYLLFVGSFFFGSVAHQLWIRERRISSEETPKIYPIKGIFTWKITGGRYQRTDYYIGRFHVDIPKHWLPYLNKDSELEAEAYFSPLSYDAQTDSFGSGTPSCVLISAGSKLRMDKDMSLGFGRYRDPLLFFIGVLFLPLAITISLQSSNAGEIFSDLTVKAKAFGHEAEYSAIPELLREAPEGYTNTVISRAAVLPSPEGLPVLLSPSDEDTKALAVLIWTFKDPEYEHRKNLFGSFMTTPRTLFGFPDTWRKFDEFVSNPEYYTMKRNILTKGEPLIAQAKKVYSSGGLFNPEEYRSVETGFRELFSSASAKFLKIENSNMESLREQHYRDLSAHIGILGKKLAAEKRALRFRPARSGRGDIPLEVAAGKAAEDNLGNPWLMKNSISGIIIRKGDDIYLDIPAGNLSQRDMMSLFGRILPWLIVICCGIPGFLLFIRSRRIIREIRGHYDML
jgi:hypothetical protein